MALVYSIRTASHTNVGPLGSVELLNARSVNPVLVIAVRLQKKLANAADTLADDT